MSQTGPRLEGQGWAHADLYGEACKEERTLFKNVYCIYMNISHT
jgi:hypothetical protein